MIAIISIMALFTLIVTFVAGLFVVYSRSYVNGHSMLPTLNSSLDLTGERDIVYINRFDDAEKGDIVVLDLRDYQNFKGYAVKRLIATEGDIVNIEYDIQVRQYNLVVNNKIVYSKPHQDFGYNTYSAFRQYINNHSQDFTRIKYIDNEPQGIIIKSNEIFVLGDNWDLSKDSSLVGPFKKSTMIGRVDIIVKPNQNELWQVLKRIF